MRRLTLFLLVVLTTSTAAADDDVRSWSLKLGKKVSAESVSAALDAAAQADDGERLLAKALGSARGPAAVKGLRELLRRPDRAVRTEVLRSAVRLGLRSEGLAESIYRSLRSTSRDRSERRAAVLALGTVGDGADMEMLLHLAASHEKDANVRDRAYRAMVTLTGKKLPFVHSRWAYWWHKQETRSLEHLRAAFKAAEAASQAAVATGKPTSLATYVAVIRQHGWIDAGITTSKLRAWLRGSRTDLRIAACHAAAHLRLADLAEDITPLLDPRRAGALHHAAEAALVQLGARTD